MLIQHFVHGKKFGTVTCLIPWAFKGEIPCFQIICDYLPRIRKSKEAFCKSLNEHGFKNSVRHCDKTIWLGCWLHYRSFSRHKDVIYKTHFKILSNFSQVIFFFLFKYNYTVHLLSLNVKVVQWVHWGRGFSLWQELLLTLRAGRLAHPQT